VMGAGAIYITISWFYTLTSNERMVIQSYMRKLT